MNFRNILALAASASIASADSIYLVAKSNSTDINGNGVGFTHEGAGINYGFLGANDQGSTVSYSDSDKTITLDTGVLQYFRVTGGYVALSVEGPDSTITFDASNNLLVNGSSSYFYGCKNTNDPYQYSTNSYEVMYYPENAPSGCLPLTLQKKAGSSPSSAPSSSSVPTTTPNSNSTTPITTSTLSTSTATSTHPAVSSTSTFTGAAMKYTPAGSFFAVVGLAAALI